VLALVKICCEGLVYDDMARRKQRRIRIEDLEKRIEELEVWRKQLTPFGFDNMKLEEQRTEWLKRFSPSPAT